MQSSTTWLRVNIITPTEVKIIKIKAPKSYQALSLLLQRFDRPPHLLKLEYCDIFWIDKDMDVIMIKQPIDWKCFLLMKKWYNLEVYAISARLTYGKTPEETDKFNFVDYLKERNVLRDND